jgi:hypothetical protein
MSTINSYGIYFGYQAGETIRIQQGYMPLPSNCIITGAFQYKDENPEYLKIVNGSIVRKSDEEIAIIISNKQYQAILSLPEKYRKIDENTELWIEKTAEEKMQANMEDWQISKSSQILFLEDNYLDFLTTMWAPLLISYNIISTDVVITIQNTSEIETLQYLSIIKSFKTTQSTRDYLDMSSQFSIFKNAIEQATIKEIGSPLDGSSILSNVIGSSGQSNLINQVANRSFSSVKSVKVIKKSWFENIKNWFSK